MMDLTNLPFPEAPEGCGDSDLWTLLAQFEFVRWLREEYTSEYDRIRDTLVRQIDRVLAAIDETEPLFRWRAARFAIALFREERIDLILRVLQDRDSFVRSQLASQLISITHPEIESRLVELLLTDSSPNVRGAACHGLAGQNPLSVIPVLIDALDTDRAVNENGRSVSNCAADALDEMMGTEFMAKRMDGVCTFPDEPPNPESVRQHSVAYLQKLKLKQRK